MSLIGALSDNSPVVTVTCPREDCGIEYLIPRHIYAQARDLGEKRNVWCPNGHRWNYTVSETERQKKRADQLEQSLANALGESNSARQRLVVANRRAAYWKGIAHRKPRVRRG